MPREIMKKAGLDAPAKPNKAPAKVGSKTKSMVTPGAGYEAQARQLNPNAGAAQKATGVGKAELAAWLQVASNILEVKPEGGLEVEEHIARGYELMKRATKPQASTIQKQIDLIRALQQDEVGYEGGAAKPMTE